MTGGRAWPVRARRARRAPGSRVPRSGIAALAGAVLVAGFGCAGTTARRLDADATPPHPAGVLRILWRTSLHDHGLFEPSPEECASGALAGDRFVIGSRGASVVGVQPETGHVDWATGVSGGVDSVAVFDGTRGQVVLGADDGSFYAIDPASGGIRWTYRGKGEIERAAEVGQDLVYVTSAADRIVALEAATGKWRWQYERDMPEGFTIHGYAGARLRGTQLLSGFADGYVVSLSAATGDVMWARSLAAASDQFVDVDTTPTLRDDVVYVSSYSGGLYGIDPRDGSVRMRVGIEGVGDITADADRLYFVAPRLGLHAAGRDGRIVWRQGLTEAGDLTRPLIFERYLIFSGSRAGMFIVDRETGALLELFNPGHGVCAAPTIDVANRRLYLLSNSGSLYALGLS
jgi:outer membrane protein assembly factor BamB